MTMSLTMDNMSNMSMDDTAFAQYAEQLEREDFESDMLKLCCSIRQLCEARLDTIAKLRASAEYLDSVWLRCRSVSENISLSMFILILHLHSQQNNNIILKDHS